MRIWIVEKLEDERPFHEEAGDGISSNFHFSVCVFYSFSKRILEHQ